MARKTNLTLLVSPEERQTLESWQRSTTIRAGLAKRGRIILLLSEGVSISEISRRVGIRRRFIYKWAKRFQEKRLCGLSDKPGRGRGPFFPSEGCDTSCEDGLRATRARRKIPLTGGLL
jgi:hypothetical protein